MKNKIEITRKQLEQFGDLISEAGLLISGMISQGQNGPLPDEVKHNKGLCKKHDGMYWWNDVLAAHKATGKASDLYAKLYDRMNQNGD